MRLAPMHGQLPVCHRDMRLAYVDGRAVLLSAAASPFNREKLRSPSPTPRQIIAIGLNYYGHAAESGFDAATGRR